MCLTHDYGDAERMFLRMFLEAVQEVYGDLNRKNSWYVRNDIKIFPEERISLIGLDARANDRYTE